VYGFTLDPLVGEFVMSHPNIKIPETGKIYSFNEGNYQMWDDATKKYMDSLKMPDLWGGTPYSVRASSLVCVSVTVLLGIIPCLLFVVLPWSCSWFQL
jgi:fructose-1,6-bisphosphatase